MRRDANRIPILDASEIEQNGPRFWRGPSRDGGIRTRDPLNPMRTVTQRSHDKE